MIGAASIAIVKGLWLCAKSKDSDKRIIDNEIALHQGELSEETIVAKKKNTVSTIHAQRAAKRKKGRWAVEAQDRLLQLSIGKIECISLSHTAPFRPFGGRVDAQGPGCSLAARVLRSWTFAALLHGKKREEGVPSELIHARYMIVESFNRLNGWQSRARGCHPTHIRRMTG